MPSLNRVQVAGHLGRDPELRYGQSGKAVCNFSVGCSSYLGKDSAGNKKEETFWANVTCFGYTAEACGQLKKGAPVYVEGRLKEDSWDDKATGAKRTKTVIIANHAWPLVREQRAQESNTGDAGRRVSEATRVAAPSVEDDPEIPF